VEGAIFCVTWNTGKPLAAGYRFALISDIAEKMMGDISDISRVTVAGIASFVGGTAVVVVG